MQKFFTCLSFCVLLGWPSVAQTSNPVFSNFYANPFQFNPSYVAANGYSEANLFYRKQWLDINNAPTSLALNLQAPVGKSVSLGFTAISDKTVLLSTSSLMATFGYRIRFSRHFLNHLDFGISAGPAFDNFDLNAVAEYSDPALTKYAQNKTYIVGRAGVNYRYKNLNIGFALPGLFQSKPNGENPFSKEFNNFLGSVSYKTNVSPDVQLIPTLVYRSLSSEERQWEAMLIASIRSFIWVGASYRQDYGITGFIGVNLKKLLRIGYSYEHPTGDISKVSGGSHEVYLGVRSMRRDRDDELFARNLQEDSIKAAVAQKKKEEEPATPVKEEAIATQPVVKSVAPADTAVSAPEVKVATIEKPELNTVSDNEPLKDVTIMKVKKDMVSSKTELEPGYYIIVGVFQNADNAERHQQRLKKEGIETNKIYNSGKHYHYVYVSQFAEKQESLEALKGVRKNTNLPGAWILHID